MSETIIELRGVSKRFGPTYDAAARLTRSITRRIGGTPRNEVVRAVDTVSMTIRCGEVVGLVTSGSQSPVLGVGIGLGYVPNDPAHTAVGSTVYVEQRGKRFRGTVRKPPLHKG